MFNLIIRFVFYNIFNVIITDFFLVYSVVFISLLGIIYKTTKYPLQAQYFLIHPCQYHHIMSVEDLLMG